MSKLEELFAHLRKTPSDINLHLDTLRELVDGVSSVEECRVVEFGTRHGWSTVALLMGNPMYLASYDIDPKPEDYRAIRQAWREHIELDPEDDQSDDYLDFFNESTLTCTIEECDILFIDTLHTGRQLQRELDRHHKKVKRFLVFHDWVSYGLQDEAPVQTEGVFYYQPGLLPVILDFLSVNREWGVHLADPRNNGLLILERRIA